MAKMRSAAGAFGKSPPGGAKAGAAGEQKAAAHAASNFASKFKKPNKGALAAAAAAPAPAAAPTETAIAAAPPPAPPTPAAAASGSDAAAAAAAAKTPGSS
jgi:hypothetical protein